MLECGSNQNVSQSPWKLSVETVETKFSKMDQVKFVEDSL